MTLDKFLKKYLHCLTPLTRNWVQAYAGSSPAMDCCPIHGESMTHTLITFETWDEHWPSMYASSLLGDVFINSAHINDNYM